MGSITRHKDKWRAHVYKNGMRESRVFATKKEAQLWASKTEVKLNELRLSGATFWQAIEKYLETFSVQKRSVAWESNTFARLAREFGEGTALGEIQQPQVSAWRDRRLKTVSGSTVNREANLLRHLFRVARDEWSWIEHDPFKGVKLPKENDSRYQVWRWQQIKRVLRARRSGKTSELQLAFHISLRTGMRLSEVLAAPKAFDPKRRVVVLRTKTEERAEIPVGRIAAKLLTGAKFTVDPNEGSTLFGKLCRELLIEDLTFHDARATALTMLARKVDVLTLAKISRHKDLKILLNTYYRETAEQIAARL